MLMAFAVLNVAIIKRVFYKGIIFANVQVVTKIFHSVFLISVIRSCVM